MGSVNHIIGNFEKWKRDQLSRLLDIIFYVGIIVEIIDVGGALLKIGIDNLIYTL